MPKTNAEIQTIQKKETGRQIQYDLQDRRQDPEKLTRWFKQRHEPQK